MPYIDFGLQDLVFASHIPPALVQAECVFAVVTSAAKVGPVKATAIPRATTAATILFMTDSSLCVAGKNSGSVQELTCHGMASSEVE
jgi:hypothetical protein